MNLPQPPTNLVNFGEAVNFPLILGLVVVLFGVATLLHLLLTSLNRRRREMGLLKSLGMRAPPDRPLRLVADHDGRYHRDRARRPTRHRGGTSDLERLRVQSGRAGATGRDDVGRRVGVAVGTLVVANLLAVVPAVVALARRPASCSLEGRRADGQASRLG